MEARNRIFQTLKPVCVQLSQATLGLAAGKGSSKEVIDGLSRLLGTLQGINIRSDLLNEKLADYVFFPLSHVLRESQKLPVRALELALECLSILLKTGWKTQIAPNLGIQLLILLTFLADKKPSSQAVLQTSEELQQVAFHCLDELLRSLTRTPEGANALIETANIPALGKAVSVMLDGILDGTSSGVQLSALAALRSFCSTVPDREALAASFLPGIVSCITKVLTPSTKIRRSYKVAEGALDLLSQVFQRVLSDSQTEGLPSEATTAPDNSPQTKLTASWLKATAAQIRLALANIIMIRHNARAEVRQALVRLSTTVLQDCREALSDSAPMMVEMLVCLSSADQQVDAEETLKRLLVIGATLANTLRSSLHQWVVSLPRIMQAQNEEGKRRIINRISVAYRLLAEQRLDLSIVDRIMASNLRDSVTSAIQDQSRSGVIVESNAPEVPLQVMAVEEQRQLASFEPLLMTSKAQEDTVIKLKGLMQQLSTSELSLSIARELVDFVQSSNGNPQLASFWLALNMIRSAFDSRISVDDFFDFGPSSSNDRTALLEELYDSSLSILINSSSDSELDWRLQALALETVALQAAQQKSDFRLELVEVLYPILHLVGSSSVALRNHALTCLNIVARACGYAHAGDLVVSNVDYLVNAVALKLNTFDISPQAPQVLLMMIKLSGPSLLPYLDDLVGSMFAALECYHGYPRLVELLFTVLKGIAEEGVKTPQFAVTSAEFPTHRKPPVVPPSIQSIAEMLVRIRTNCEETQNPASNDNELATPSTPWQSSEGKKDIENSSVDSEGASAMSGSQRDEQQVVESEEVPPPAPKTYNLLLNISQLTQHYLTSSSPILRASLLSLLDITLPALATHENSFLPLINTLWPVFVRRLEDPEAYVVASTLDVIGVMCMHAGDFMTGRIEAVWQEMKKIYNRRAGAGAPDRAPDTQKAISITSLVEEKGVSNTHSSLAQGITTARSAAPVHYIDAPTRIVWESLVRLLTTLTDYVAVDEDTFDDIVEMLAPVLQQRAEVKAALERRNPDAVWLALFNLKSQRPSEGKRPASPDRATRRPVSKRNWAFANVVY